MIDEAPRKLPQQTPRVETGPVEFGDDWPGVFIRGDNAANYACFLFALLSDTTAEDERAIAKIILRGLYDDLRSCVVGPMHAMFPALPSPGGTQHAEPNA